MRTGFWADWSERGWRAHLPGEEDPAALVNGLSDATLHALAHDHAQSGETAFRIGTASISHAELDVTAARFAGWLTGRIAPGDRVLLSGPSTVDFIAGYLGILRAGGIVVLANPAYTAVELAYLVEDSGASGALVAPEVAERLPELPLLVTLDGGLPRAEPDHRLDRTGPDDVALLAYTSGTTGKPKGVPLTHRRTLASIRAELAAWRFTGDDVLVHALPLFHQHGLGGVHAALITGASAVLLPKFSPDDLVNAADDHGATVLFAVPTMYERLCEAGIAPKNLRLCVCGSAPLSPALAERTAALFGGLPLVRYGTTETGLDVSNPVGDTHPHTVGLPLPGVSVRLDTKDAEPDGEIQLSGPQVFGGYWRDDEATAQAFTEDGWFRTGDIGRLDEATGHLVIAGRTKELIISGGLNVYPREVEIALESHPAVAEVAVAGLPDERWGEEVTAWVVPRDGHAFDETGILEHARGMLAPYKCPKQVFRVAALPRNHMGKIVRTELGRNHV
jgi:acyl-CoA synthetase (AMP-forming)/AMP-acid ligase II